MGHLVGKALYRALGRKIDGLSVRAPWTEALHAILKELYSEEDAELVVRMPFGLSRLGRLEKATGIPRSKLAPHLESLCARGLVLDLCLGDEVWYAPSPMVVGIFEFTMMRAGPGLDLKKRAGLFREYMEEGTFYERNFAAGQRVSIARTVPHEGTVWPDEYVEVLDYEKAAAIVESSDRFALGLCSCRHERHHLGEKRCEAPLDNCSAFGVAADHLVRHGLAREVSKTEMLENVARSRELGLVLNADNVQRKVSFLCHCCPCCCNVLLGVTKHGFPNAVVTSSFVARPDLDRCLGCGKCTKRCPVGAVPRVADPHPRYRKHGRPEVDGDRCIGCGVCAVACNAGAMRLAKREQRVLHPETTFERVILQCLERGTLENLLFDDPASKSQAFLRGLVGGFLRLPPVQQALMSDALRSRFLAAMKKGASGRGSRDLAEV